MCVRAPTASGVISFIFHFDPSIAFAVKYRDNVFKHIHLARLWCHNCADNSRDVSAFLFLSWIGVHKNHTCVHISSPTSWPPLLLLLYPCARLYTCCVSVFVVLIFISASSLDVSPIAFRRTVISSTTSSACQDYIVCVSQRFDAHDSPTLHSSAVAIRLLHNLIQR